MAIAKSLLNPVPEQRYAARLRDAFKQNGWRVEENPRVKNREADMAVSKAGCRYLIELKAISEGRRDRLVPVLAQAILQAQAISKASSKLAMPMAVVAAPRISAAVVSHLERFLDDNAPDVAAGFVDDEGLLQLRGVGLEELNERPARRFRQRKIVVPESSQLLSDLNQWMLKVMLAPEIPVGMLNAPRGEYRNASQLAEAANVSPMSAFRFLRQLRLDGFLDDEGDALRIVRREELMRRWQAVYMRSVADLPLRWIIRGGSSQRLQETLQRNAERNNMPRACLALFAAANVLGKGFVHGLMPYIYVEKFDPVYLKELGLSAEGAEQSPDVFVRVPLFHEAVFRAAVVRDGVPAADILQVWLDVSAFPARGSAQADELRMGVLAPLFSKVEK